MSKKLYFCGGCRQVHNDQYFDESYGDSLITDWDKFMSSVNETNGDLKGDNGE